MYDSWRKWAFNTADQTDPARPYYFPAYPKAMNAGRPPLFVAPRSRLRSAQDVTLPIRRLAKACAAVRQTCPNRYSVYLPSSLCPPIASQHTMPPGDQRGDGGWQRVSCTCARTASHLAGSVVTIPRGV